MEYAKYFPLMWMASSCPGQNLGSQLQSTRFLSFTLELPWLWLPAFVVTITSVANTSALHTPSPSENDLNRQFSEKSHQHLILDVYNVYVCFGCQISINMQGKCDHCKPLLTGYLVVKCRNSSYFDKSPPLPNARLGENLVMLEKSVKCILHNLGTDIQIQGRSKKQYCVSK